jgi:hypothetical protein
MSRFCAVVLNTTSGVTDEVSVATDCSFGELALRRFFGLETPLTKRKRLGESDVVNAVGTALGEELVTISPLGRSLDAPATEGLFDHIRLGSHERGITKPPHLRP